MSIHLLDSETINRIAAGEVIERPASVVKELAENAFDAGASSVTIEIRDGGQSLIRVTDNGRGIPEEEVKSAFLRHATSKIQDAEDLLRVRSLGFRGEALSSIAAVSRCELITKTRDSITGTRYLIEGGEERTLEQVGAPEGTTVIVRDLFYCTPVRRKFLKSPATETAHIAELCGQLALSHPKVSLRLIINGQRRFGTGGNGSLKDILYQLYGRDFSAGLLPVSAENEFFRLEGFLGKPELCRGSRALQHFCVNGRYIKSPVLQKALEDGYGNLLMQHSFPAAVLLLTLDPLRVDVNVHPAKREVRFSDPEGLYRFVRESVSECLRRMELIRDIRLKEPAEPKPAARDAVPEKTLPEAPLTGKPSPELPVPENPSSESPAAERAWKPAAAPIPPVLREQFRRPAEPFEEKRAVLERSQTEKQETAETADPVFQERGGQLSFLNPEHRDQVRLIGEVFDTYLIAEWSGALYIIDQHAAHEKVNYERLRKASEEGAVPSQRLMPPIVLNLTDRESVLFERHLPEFEALGYEAEAFGPRSYVVRAVPDVLPSVLKDQLLQDMIGELSEETGPGLPMRLLQKTASLSCKAAVKGNQSLSSAEAEALLTELFSLEDPYNCPHGRPTVIRLTKYELDRRFRRIV